MRIRIRPLFRRSIRIAPGVSVSLAPGRSGRRSTAAQPQGSFLARLILAVLLLGGAFGGVWLLFKLYQFGRS